MKKQTRNTLAVLALLVVAALFLSGTLSPSSGSSIITGFQVQLVDSKGTVQHSILASQNIFAQLPSGTVDITQYLASPMGAGYASGIRMYFMITPQVTTTFTASSNNTGCVYRAAWNYVLYPAETSTVYQYVYPFLQITSSQNPVTFQYVKTSHTYAQTSGQQILLNDAGDNIPILIAVGPLAPLPAGGGTYTIKTEVIMTAWLYVDNVVVSNKTQTADLSITISNQAPTGSITVLSVSFTTGAVQINH
jgi:hypothetical protein